MDVWESEMAELLGANRIELTQTEISHSINGVPDETEHFIKLSIYDSEKLERIIHNKRLLDKKCEEIKDSVLSYLKTVEMPPYHEVRIEIIKDNGFLMFKSEKKQTVQFKVNG